MELADEPNGTAPSSVAGAAANGPDPADKAESGIAEDVEPAQLGNIVPSDGPKDTGRITCTTLETPKEEMPVAEENGQPASPVSEPEESIKAEELDSPKTPDERAAALETPPALEPPKHALESESPPAKRPKTEMVVVPTKKPELFYTPLKTGLVYDVRMRYHAKIFTSYYEYIDPHPEDPRRIYRIYKALAEAGLIQDPLLSGRAELGELMVKIPIREAAEEEILEVHLPQHLAYIRLTEAMLREQLLEETEKGDSIYVNNDLYLLAKLSCGGAIEACRAVVEGRCRNLMAVVRPPGHHAEPDSPGGFCLFSNVAVAAKCMLRQYPDSVRRIVIVDWDIHHGNGTQKAFFSDPRVLYVLLHRYENGKFYPGTRYGALDVVGSGAGEGFSVNVPWLLPGAGDADYMYAFHKVVLPIVSEFDPDLVIVSAGFDAADGDLIGQCHVSPAGYGHMTHALKAVARGRLAVILEGGYNLDAISSLALAVARVLLGEPPEHTVTAQPRPDTVEVVGELARVHAQYWKCMRFGVPGSFYEGDAPLLFADLLRAHQAHQWWKKYTFVSLPLPPHFGELAVLASSNASLCSTLVVCVHDPPEVWASVSVAGTLDPLRLVVLEAPLGKLVEKIRLEIPDVGYVDVNAPLDATLAQEMLLWVWDNYLMYFAQLRRVVFVGFGDAYQPVVLLYAKRPHEAKELVRGTVAFVARTLLKAIVPVIDELMVDWYYTNSLVFASHLNACWARDDGERRPRRKYGRVMKALLDGLWDVVGENFDEGVDFVLDSIED